MSCLLLSRPVHHQIHVEKKFSTRLPKPHAIILCVNPALFQEAIDALLALFQEAIDALLALFQEAIDTHP
jgi:hypothetical protein